MDDLNPGQDNFQLSWYTEPHYTIILLNEDGSSSTVVGTFRSPKCKRVAEYEYLRINALTVLTFQSSRLSGNDVFYEQRERRLIKKTEPYTFGMTK